ncbi:MAG: class I SAM-dependent methyltransferase [Candidatus Magnetobacterium sp. LHC-1]|nr:class I SAM-dependent methyltransferase [Nitrospirota bacterium]
MDTLSKEYVVSFYDNTLRLHGDRPEALRWTSQGQMLHYEALVATDNVIAGSVLDYGCGKGDLYQFLRQNGYHIQYTGMDINPRLIAKAKENYPEARFMVFDAEETELTEDFDYIFLCGVFNLKVEGIEETIKNVLRRLFKHCRKTLVFNALSAHNPAKSYELSYVYPETLVNFALSELSSHITLRHDRLPYDFFLFMHKR